MPQCKQCKTRNMKYTLKLIHVSATSLTMSHPQTLSFNVLKSILTTVVKHFCNHIHALTQQHEPLSPECLLQTLITSLEWALQSMPHPLTLRKSVPASERPTPALCVWFNGRPLIRLYSAFELAHISSRDDAAWWSHAGLCRLTVVWWTAEVMRVDLGHTC